MLAVFSDTIMHVSYWFPRRPYHRYWYRVVVRQRSAALPKAKMLHNCTSLLAIDI